MNYSKLIILGILLIFNLNIPVKSLTNAGKDLNIYIPGVDGIPNSNSHIIKKISFSKLIDIANKYSLKALNSAGLLILGYQITVEISKKLQLKLWFNHIRQFFTKRLTFKRNHNYNDHNINYHIDMKSINEIKHEQEELWKIIHSLYQNQNEKIEKLENAIDSLMNKVDIALDSRQNHMKLNDEIEQLKSNFLDYNMKTNKNDKEMENIMNVVKKQSSNDIQMMKRDFEIFKELEFPKILKEYESNILNKLDKFNDTIKKMKREVKEL
jgi:hypothetical protein